MAARSKPKATTTKKPAAAPAPAGTAAEPQATTEPAEAGAEDASQDAGSVEALNEAAEFEGQDPDGSTDAAPTGGELVHSLPIPEYLHTSAIDPLNLPSDLKAALQGWLGCLFDIDRNHIVRARDGRELRLSVADAALDLHAL